MKDVDSRLGRREEAEPGDLWDRMSKGRETPHRDVRGR